jgi:hypothetical protein
MLIGFVPGKLSRKSFRFIPSLKPLHSGESATEHCAAALAAPIKTAANNPIKTKTRFNIRTTIYTEIHPTRDRIRGRESGYGESVTGFSTDGPIPVTGIPVTY